MSRPAIRIATLSVAVGLAVMIVSVGVVFGFKHTISQKVMGFSSDIVVESFASLHGIADTPISADDSLMRVVRGIHGVKHVQPYAYKQGILKTETDFLGIVFKGISEQYDTAFIHSSMQEGQIPHFSQTKSDNEILISQSIAQKLRLKVGDRVFAYFLGDGSVRTRRFLVRGIYCTNLSQFDLNTCFLDLHTVQRLNGWQEDDVNGLELSLTDRNESPIVAESVIEKINNKRDAKGETISSLTIEEMYPQIFSWLSLLDLNVWIILALMLAVAAVTMVSGLLIIILERTNMIGTLKALGARNATIRHTFLWFSVFIIFKGMLWGDVLGCGILLLQMLTGVVKLDPAVYYVSAVPVEFSFLWIILLNVATIAVSLFVLVAPSFLISHIHPAKSMKYE